MVKKTFKTTAVKVMRIAMEEKRLGSSPSIAKAAGNLQPVSRMKGVSGWKVTKRRRCKGSEDSW